MSKIPRLPFEAPPDNLTKRFLSVPDKKEFAAFVEGLIIQGWWAIHEMPANKPILVPDTENTVMVFPRPYEAGIWHADMMERGLLELPEGVRPVEITSKDQLMGYTIRAWKGEGR